MSAKGDPVLDEHLSVFVKARPQAEVARLLGVSQGAVSQMLRSERRIYVKCVPGGGYEFYEIKTLSRAVGE